MFVLGYRAKKMRQAKLSDLIHMSEGFVSPESCSVEVHFQRIVDLAEGTEEYRTVEGSKLVVSRTAYRNNRNVYHVNGTVSNYSDVTGLLKSQGIDLDHKRFLILQGEVEAIALMKPKGANEHEEGLLEYLEDIIGTNQYIPAIEEAAKELDKANELYAEKLLRVRAAARECDALRVEKEEAESYLRQENSRTERKNEMLQAKLWKSVKELSSVETKLNLQRHDLAEERSKNAKDAVLVESLEETLKEAIRDTAELDKKAKMVQAELSTLEKNDLQMQETRKHLKTKLRSLTKQSSDGVKAEADLQRHMEDITIGIETISTDLRDKQKDLVKNKAELDKISASLKGVTAKHQKTLDDKQAELEPLQSDLRNAQQEFDLAKTSLALLEEKASAGVKEHSRLVEKREQVDAEIKMADERLTGLSVQDREAKAKLERGKRSLDELETTRGNAAKTLQVLQSTLSEAMAALHQNESGTAVHKTLMREAKAGRIRGIHVGDEF